MELKKKEINVRFAKSPDYKKFMATGVWGGPNPQGDIFCNFFIEYPELPKSLKLEIDPKDGSSKELERVTEKNIVREIQACVVIRPDIAKLVGQWLIDHANKLMGQE